MSKQSSDIELASKEREDIFDLYYNTIENFKLEFIKNQEKEDSPNYELIEKALTVLERNLDDLAKYEFKKPRIVNLGNFTVKTFLYDWKDIFNKLGRRKGFIRDFTYTILIVSSILSKIELLESIIFRKYIKGLSPSREDRIYFEENKIEIRDNLGLAKTYRSSILNKLSQIFGDKSDELNLARHKIDDDFNIDLVARSLKIRREENIFESIYFDKFLDIDIEEYRKKINTSKIISEIQKEREYPLDASFEWSMTLKFDNDSDEYRANQIAYSIWVISEALEKIDGVTITLEDSGIGSRWFKFKIGIKDELTKQEVKEVLNKSKEALQAHYLEKPIEEAKKIKAEREKVEKETKSIVNEEDAKKIRDLEIEKLRLENEAAKVNIMKGKLELIQGISKLISDGIVQNDSNIQLMLNDMLFLEKKNDSVNEGENIEIIEEDGIVKPPEKDDTIEA
ncbi:hypothetical protein EZY14_017570 [Kordia sp. TARA_039_SRF]|nr:hypothetical protein EZY14_017570 [Kordia sp. TARA_039_SRF]